jgi:hypothetical protein
MRKRRRPGRGPLALVLVVAIATGALSGVAMASGSPSAGGATTSTGTTTTTDTTTTTTTTSQLGDLPIDPQWLSNTLQRAIATTSVKNNTIPGAIENRDLAEAQWNAAEAKWKGHKGTQPNPLAKPEYLVVWAAKQNAADIEGKEVGLLAENGTINPEGLSEMLDPQFLPGLDGFVVVDARKYNVDGTLNPEYGTVVNFVQLPAPWGIETEAHHMQYEWVNGAPIIAGGLFNDTIFMLSVKDIPNMSLLNIDPPQEHTGGSVPDAFDEAGNTGDYIGTLMGGPLSNFGGSPGEVVTFKPCAQGLCQVAQVPAGNVGGVETGNAGGVPEPCTIREGEPLETCANPHGIQIRQDLDRMVTADYAEPREIILDPVKPVDPYAFRPTVRIWDTSDPLHPKLIAVAHLPSGPQNDANPGHDDPLGVMEDAETWPDATQYHGGINSKAFFAESMCGGGIYMTPNVLTNKGNASSQWQEVWNDGISEELAPGGQSLDEPGGCDGGSWVQVSPSNTILFHTIIGRAPLSDNYFDQGEIKLVYDINISNLIKDADKGHVLCNLDAGIHTDGYDLSAMQLFDELAEGKRVADCPYLISDLVVTDPTTGGPHWAALDNQSIDTDGIPYRLSFSDYFVARSGVDGDHMMYIVDISPTGVLSYDTDFRDENTGSVGIDFNRRDWPGSPDAGFYKPHSMVWVCPPGICPENAAPTPRSVFDADISHGHRAKKSTRRKRDSSKKRRHKAVHSKKKKR